jgi:hypothetical protein
MSLSVCVADTPPPPIQLRKHVPTGYEPQRGSRRLAVGCRHFRGLGRLAPADPTRARGRDHSGSRILPDRSQGAPLSVRKVLRRNMVYSLNENVLVFFRNPSTPDHVTGTRVAPHLALAPVRRGPQASRARPLIFPDYHVWKDSYFPALSASGDAYKAMDETCLELHGLCRTKWVFFRMRTSM